MAPEVGKVDEYFTYFTRPIIAVRNPELGLLCINEGYSAATQQLAAAAAYFKTGLSKAKY